MRYFLLKESDKQNTGWIFEKTGDSYIVTYWVDVNNIWNKSSRTLYYQNLDKFKNKEWIIKEITKQELFVEIL